MGTVSKHSDDINGGGKSSPSVGFTPDALPDALPEARKLFPAEDSQTGMSANNAPIGTEILAGKSRSKKFLHWCALGTTFKSKIKRIRFYTKLKYFLSRHNKTALFLSHGGLHLVVLVVLIVICVLLGMSVYDSTNKKLFIVECGKDYVDAAISVSHKLDYYSLKISRRAKNSDFFVLETNHIESESVPSDKKYLWTYNVNVPRVKYSIHGRIDAGKSPTIHPTYKKNGFKVLFDKSWEAYDMPLLTTGNLIREPQRFDLNPYYNVMFKTKQDYYDLKDSLAKGSSFACPEISVDLTNPTAESVIVFENIYPKPDEVSVNKFSFKGKESVERVLKNGGFYFEAKDKAKSYDAEMLVTTMSVFMGTIIAFCLDIMIQLIYKWRRLKT